jgi:hypothetical protein
MPPLRGGALAISPPRRGGICIAKRNPLIPHPVRGAISLFIPGKKKVFGVKQEIPAISEGNKLMPNNSRKRLNPYKTT